MSAMKYATQNIPNIVSLENGNEEAVKHKRTCLAMSVPNSPRSLLLETDVFKITLRKLCLRSPSDGCGRMAIPRKKRLGFQEIRMHPSEAASLLRPFYLQYLFLTSAVTLWGFF